MDTITKPNSLLLQATMSHEPISNHLKLKITGPFLVLPGEKCSYIKHDSSIFIPYKQFVEKKRVTR